MEDKDDVQFYNRLYTKDLQWGSNDIPDIPTLYTKFSSYSPMNGKDWLYELWLNTYSYLFFGNPYIFTENHANYNETNLNNYYQLNVKDRSDLDYNLILTTNIHEHIVPDENGKNNLMISKNYSIVFSMNAFPNDIII